MIVPTLAREWALWRSGARRVAGVDEVGMACLAGPVVAAALVVKPYCRKIPGVRDSKTLSLQQRERLYDDILRSAAAVGVGAASVTEINKLNILRASHVAKVTRDRLMNKLAARSPGYGWEHNVGYATRHHLQGLRANGLTPFH